MLGLDWDPRMHVALMVTGFPTVNRPDRGIFNARTAVALSKQIKVDVLFFRTWSFKRHFVEHSYHNGLSVYTLWCPWIPKFSGLSTRIAASIGACHLRHILTSVNLLHSVDMTLAAQVAAVWSARFALPHVNQLISSMRLDNEPILRRYTPLLSTIFRIFCNSDAVKEHFQQRFPSYSQAFTLRRGVDINEFGPPAANTSPSSSTETVFLYLGGFPSYGQQNVKGEQTLTEAWALLEGMLTPFNCRLLLAGPRSDCSNAQKWRQRLRYPEAVTLVGLVHPNEMRQYYYQCNAVVIPSTSEGLPNVAMEAGACGRPVIGSRIPAITEVVIDGETGILFEPGDPHSLATTLRNVAQGTFDLHRLGHQARKRIEHNFSLNSYVAQLITHYHDVLASLPTTSQYSNQVN